MRTPDDKEKFLTELEQTPFPSIACKRVGISKATIYRWRSEDSKFKKDMDAAIETGRETITESAEAHTVMLIKKGEFRAIRLWLENNTTRYYKPKKAIPAPRTERIISTVKLEVVDSAGKPLSAKKVEAENEKRKEEKPLTFKRDGKIYQIVSPLPKRPPTDTGGSKFGSGT